MAEDRRTRYTKSQIKEAVIELLKQKPINKISVTEVCRMVDINRGTFYLHYEDCYQVLEELQEEFCDEMISMLNSKMDEHPLDCIESLHQINQNNEDLYLVLMRSEYPTHAFRKFINYGKKILLQQISVNTTLSPQEQEWLADYIIAADLAYDQQILTKEENMDRERIIHEFTQAGIEHFKKEV